MSAKMALLINFILSSAPRLCVIKANQMSVLTSFKVMLPTPSRIGCRLSSQSIERQTPKLVTRMRRFQEMNKRIQIKDKVAPSFELIYKAPMSTLIKLASYFTVASATIVCCVGAYIYIFGDNYDWDFAFRHSDFIAAESIADLWIFVAGFTAATLGLRFVASRYVLRIYKHEKDYIAITQGLLRSTRRKCYTIGDASRADNGTFFLKNKRHFVLEDYFITFREVALMLDKHDYIVRQNL